MYFSLFGVWVCGKIEYELILNAHNNNLQFTSTGYFFLQASHSTNIFFFKLVNISFELYKLIITRNIYVDGENWIQIYSFYRTSSLLSTFMHQRIAIYQVWLDIHVSLNVLLEINCLVFIYIYVLLNFLLRIISTKLSWTLYQKKKKKSSLHFSQIF